MSCSSQILPIHPAQLILLYLIFQPEALYCYDPPKGTTARSVLCNVHRVQELPQTVLRTCRIYFLDLYTSKWLPPNILSFLFSTRPLFFHTSVIACHCLLGTAMDDGPTNSHQACFHYQQPGRCVKWMITVEVFCVPLQCWDWWLVSNVLPNRTFQPKAGKCVLPVDVSFSCQKQWTTEWRLSRLSEARPAALSYCGSKSTMLKKKLCTLVQGIGPIFEEMFDCSGTSNLSCTRFQLLKSCSSMMEQLEYALSCVR